MLNGSPKYEHFPVLDGLLAERLITKRKHPDLPLWIYNYSRSAQALPLAQWPEPLKDCRGLILDENGKIIGRPFRKFWNYEQVQDQIPVGEPFNVWEKLDGSLGIVCTFEGQRVVSTRGSFESDQAKWAAAHFALEYPDFYPEDGATYLFEIIYPENRIVVDYGDSADVFLLAVLDREAQNRWDLFYDEHGFLRAQQFDGLRDFDSIDSNPAYAGQEGFVIQWASGFRAKVKLTEYKRLHRLITQCSTRTIWELLRSGQDTTELLDRVPAEFAAWAKSQIDGLTNSHADISAWAESTLRAAPSYSTRREFAEFAKAQKHPGLLFSLLDGKPTADAIWKIIEPKWATPFRQEEA